MSVTDDLRSHSVVERGVDASARLDALVVHCRYTVVLRQPITAVVVSRVITSFVACSETQ